MCRKGLHRMEGDNLQPIPSGGYRCRTCKQEADGRRVWQCIIRRWPHDPALDRDQLAADATPDGHALIDVTFDRHEDFGGQWLVLTATAKPIRCTRGLHVMTEANQIKRQDGIRCKGCKRLSDQEQRAKKAVQTVVLRPRMGERTFPVAPLLRVLERSSVDLHDTDWQRVKRAKMDGQLAEVIADHLACRLKLHPCLIWPDWFSEEVAA